MGSSSSTTKKKNAATNVVKTSNSQNQNNSSANQHPDNSSSANQKPDHNSTANQKPNSESQSQHNSTANQHPDNNSSANQQAGHGDSANQKPDNKKSISPTATDSSSSSQESAQTVKTQSVNKSTVMGSVDRWQDADLANLIGGLSIEDVQSKWEDLVDQLVSRYDPKVIPEKEVSFCFNSLYATSDCCLLPQELEVWSLYHIYSLKIRSLFQPNEIVSFFGFEAI